MLKKDTDFFGLDIGSTAIRVVQLKNDGESHSLVTYGSMEIEDNISRSDSAADKKKLANAIKELLQNTKVSTNNVVAGLPSDKVFTSIVSMPKVTQQELSKAIQYQADQYIPMPVKDAQIDWTVLDEDDGSGQTNVLLVAAQKNHTETLLDMLESIGLEVKAIEPDAVATTRSVMSRTAENTVAIIDVGAYSSDIIVAHNRNPWVVRSVPVGGNTLIKAASKNLNVDEEQAGQFVRKFGLTQNKLEGQVYKALKPSVSSLTDEVSKSIKFYNSRYQNNAIEKIILTGGITGWPDFPLHIADTLNLPVEIGNSWINISYQASQQDALMNVSSRFAVVNGLAQRKE